MNRLFEGYVLRELASYRGTLRALEDGRAHLPSPDDSWVQSQLQLLREHLPGETDLFLLTYGLIVPGVMRGLNPPVLALAENRGGFSPPRRQQAAAQIERLREVLALGSLLAPAREDTSTTLAELHQKLSAFQREPDDDWVAHHAALSEIEVRALTERTLQLHGSHPELATEILAGLAELRAEGLPPEDIRALLKRGCYFPPTLYRNAPPDVVAALTGLLPDPRVSAALEWTRNSELISLRCYHLDAAEDGVPCQAPTGEACHACGGPLVWLFDFTSTPECLPAGAPFGPPAVLCASAIRRSSFATTAPGIRPPSGARSTESPWKRLSHIGGRGKAIPPSPAPAPSSVRTPARWAARPAGCKNRPTRNARVVPA